MCFFDELKKQDPDIDYKTVRQETTGLVVVLLLFADYR